MMGLLEGGSMSLGEKPRVAWLAVRAEFQKIKENQLKWALKRNVRHLKHKDVRAYITHCTMILTCYCTIRRMRRK